jgi:hypothetical protein
MNTFYHLLKMKKSAILSDDRLYRYSLSRIWDSSLPTVMFIGLNPSTADETENDPTINRCIGFAKSWGYGGLVMTNLFAFRSTDPKILKSVKEPIGDKNNDWLIQLAKESKIIIAAWGTNGTLLNRDKEIKKLFPTLYCLELSKENHPKHPLYLKKTKTPIRF